MAEESSAVASRGMVYTIFDLGFLICIVEVGHRKEVYRLRHPTGAPG